MTGNWWTSRDLVEALEPVRDNDVRVAFDGHHIPVSGVFYHPLKDSYVIELAEGEQLADARRPELWGTAQVAEFLGVSKQHVHQLATQHPDLLPPVAKFPGSRGTRVWLASTWRVFAATGPQKDLRRWRDLRR